MADAADNGDRTLHGFQDFKKSKGFRCLRDPVSPFGAPDGADHSRFAQFDDETADVFFGYLLRLRDLMDHARFCPVIQGEIQHDAQPVSSFCGNLHENTPL